MSIFDFCYLQQAFDVGYGRHAGAFAACLSLTDLCRFTLRIFCVAGIFLWENSVGPVK